MSIRYWLLGFGLLVALPAAGQVDNNRVVAVVNGEQILGAEYYRRMEFLPAVGRRVGNQIFEYPPGLLTIEQLITERLILQLAREKGVYPTDAEVQHEIQVAISEQSNLMQNWLDSGRNQAELQYLFRVQVAQFKLQTAGVNITDQEVENFYKENPPLFTTPRRAKLRIIATRDASKRAVVDQALASGRPFADVAREHSEDVSRAVGGEFGQVALNALTEPMRNAINAVRIGQTTEWVTSGSTYMKFLVENISPEEVKPLDDQLRRAIRRRMMIDRGAVRNNWQRDLMELRRRAVVEIRQPEFARLYQQLVQQAFEGSDSGSTPAGQPTPPPSNGGR